MPAACWRGQGEVSNPLAVAPHRVEASRGAGYESKSSAIAVCARHDT